MTLFHKLYDLFFTPKPCRRLKRAYEKAGWRILDYKGGSKKCMLLVETLSGNRIMVNCVTKGIVISCFSSRVLTPERKEFFRDVPT